jgi:hypothetical protein
LDQRGLTARSRDAKVGPRPQIPNEFAVVGMSEQGEFRGNKYCTAAAIEEHGTDQRL